jgi:hypothetical protein
MICALERHENFKLYKARAERITSKYHLHTPTEE